VEDEPDFSEALAEILGLEGYAVVQASNGREGLKALAAVKGPCLVLVDMMMPVLGGYGFLEAMRADAQWSTVPVLVVTGSHLEAPPPGAMELLRKPFEIPALLAAVRRYCPPP
jgi:DNA-binding response OmpR family regulator